jgi:hypothetical protein
LGKNFADIEEKYDLSEAKEGFGEEGEESDSEDRDDDNEDSDNDDDNDTGDDAKNSGYLDDSFEAY